MDHPKTHCARCGEAFADCPEERDGFCEYCLDQVEAYERQQAETEYEYNQQGGDEDRRSGR